MGRAIGALIDRELASVATASGDDSPVLAKRVREQLARREADVASRERAVAAAEERLRGSGERLRLWVAELEDMTQRVEVASKLAVQRRDTTPRVGAMTGVRADPSSSASTVTAYPLGNPSD
jgi:hypothetical protein